MYGLPAASATRCSPETYQRHDTLRYSCNDVRVGVKEYIFIQDLPSSIFRQNHHDGLVVVGTLDPFPPLAVEIVRRILELFAYEDSSTSATLIPVCREVQKWITPILYKTVVLRNAKQLMAFAQTVQTSKLGNCVRTLVIQTCGYVLMSPYVSKAIRGCPQLDTLFTKGYTAHPVLTDTSGLSFPRPRHGMFLEGGASVRQRTVQFSHPLVQNITHLYVFAPNAGYVFEGDLHVTALISIASLTHLAFEGVPHGHHLDGYIKRLLRESPSLRVLLVLSDNHMKPVKLVGPVWTALAQVMDERLYAGNPPTTDELIELVTSGRTVWDDAEIKYKGWRDQVESSPHLG